MNTSLINETNTKLNDIIESLKSVKDEYENKLVNNKSQIDDELAKVDEYKNLFYEAKKKIQKMTDDINGFEEDYKNLVEKFQDDELSNILTGVSKEINAKIKEKKRSIQKDQEEMNALIDKAQNAKKSLVRLTAEKKVLENSLRQIADVYKYYDEEFEKISMYTQEHFDNLHPDENAFEVVNVEEDINIDDIEIDEKEEIVKDEDLEQTGEFEAVSDETEETIDSDDEEVVELTINEPNEEVQEDDVNMEEIKETMEKQSEMIQEEIQKLIDEEPEIDFNVDDVVIDDDLDNDEDDEEAIKSFLEKDENNLDEQ